MKKFFRFFFCLLLATGGCLSSCKDDDNDDKAELRLDDEKVLAQGINANSTGGVYELKVSSNSNWEVVEPEDVDWLSAYRESANGNYSVFIVVDPNNGMETVGREADVIIKSNDETLKIHVRQTPPISSNSTNFGFFPNVSTSYGLGMGYDIENGKVVSSVINMEVIKKLIDEDKDDIYGFSELFMWSKVASIVGNDAIIDSIEQKVDTLGIHAQLSIAYNMFNFEIKGDYDAGEERSDSTFHYSTSTNYPLVTASTSLSSVVAWYNDKATIEEKPRLKNIFCKGVTNLMTKIENTNDENEFNTLVKNLTDNYGTMIVTKTDVGGAAILDALIDTAYTTSFMKVNNAKVATDIKMGLFKLDAEVDVDYTKSATDILSHSRRYYRLMGGKNLQSIYDTFNKKEVNVSDLRKQLVTWMGSITADLGSEDFNASVISLQCTPIWFIFDDARTSERVRKRILTTHRGSQLKMWRNK